MLTTPMNKYRAAMTETLENLIAIKSVKAPPSLNMPYGKGVFSALMYMLDRAERLDLESYNLFGHMGSVSYGKGDETLAILTHLDVVPAGEGWDTDPFKAVIKDGKIFGRGAVDDKGAAVASLFALYAIKESCITLNKRVLLLFGCDEETGWGDIDFFKANYPDPEIVISPDASFPIFNSEKGLLHISLSAPAKNNGVLKSIDSGTRVNIVPSRARCEIALTDEQKEIIAKNGCGAEFFFEEENGVTVIRAEGKAAHGAHPEEGINALTRLMHALIESGADMGEAGRFIKALCDLVGFETDGKTLGIAQSDEISGALSLNLGTMHTDGETITAAIDIRTPISTDVNALYLKLKKLFDGYGIEISEMQLKEPHHVSEDDRVIKALKKVYRVYKGGEAQCLCSSGATYARAFKNGVAFGPVDPGKDRCEHGPNECIEIDDLVKLAELIAEAIIELAAVPDSII